MYVIDSNTLKSTNSLYLSRGGSKFEIRYNPKVSNFKYSVQEQNIQTLGSVYPFIRRNGMQCFRQFNIEGMISARVENDLKFNSFADEVEGEKTYRDSLVSFLYNEAPVVFSSATEGEMIVRLMNVSLTPNVQLGRRIYSFTAQAIEVAEFTQENVAKYCNVPVEG